MQYFADGNFRQDASPRMFGQRSPYFPGRASDRSVPSVDEILRRGEAMPGRYLDERPPQSVPPPTSPQNLAWLSSPRRNGFPTDRRDVDFAKDDADYMYAFQRNPPGSPTDPSHGDYSKDPPNYIITCRENIPGGRAEDGSPTDPRRNGSPNALRRSGSPIGPLPGRCGSPIGPLPGRSGSPIGPLQGRSGSPIGPLPGRCGSPICPLPGRCGSPNYANIFGRNLPGGQAMFNDMRALPINPADPRLRTQKSKQGRRPAHWSNYEDGSSENDHGNRSSHTFDGNRSFQNFEGNPSSQNFNDNRSFQNFDGNRSSQNFDGSHSFQNFEGNRSFQNSHGNRSTQNFDGNRSSHKFDGNRSSHNFGGNRSSIYLNDFEHYRSDNDSGFIDARPRCEAGRRNFGNFGGSNDTNYGRIDRIGGYNPQRNHFQPHLHPFESYRPEMGRKRKAQEFDNGWSETEKRPCPEQTRKSPIFRIGGYILDIASHYGGRRKLPQAEEKSHAVRFFKKYPVYRIRSKQSKIAASVRYHFMEDGNKPDDDAFIRHTIAEEWAKVYREKKYRSWANWWNDFQDCGRAIGKELERFDGFAVKRNFEPPEGPIDSEAYLRLAVVALQENNITYLKNMRYLYRLVDFNVLQNLSANASGHLQDIIRSIPNHLWRYKMRSFIFLWSWYNKMANSKEPDGQTNHQTIIQLWNNPVLHWLAKQAFDEMVIISKIEYKGFKVALLQGPPKGLLPLPHQEDQS